MNKDIESLRFMAYFDKEDRCNSPSLLSLYLLLGSCIPISIYYFLESFSAMFVPIKVVANLCILFHVHTNVNVFCYIFIQDIEELMKEVQEARRIKMLHQPSKVDNLLFKMLSVLQEAKSCIFDLYGIFSFPSHFYQ